MVSYIRGAALLVALSVSLTLMASTSAPAASAAGLASNARGAQVIDEPTVLDEFDPFAPDAEQKLQELDQLYKTATDKSPWLENSDPLGARARSGCFRSQCKVFALVRKSAQRLYLYVDGNPHSEWLVSTGAPGHETPNFDRHPNGRIYDEYSSRTFPGGNYQGLGNMPYAVFIEGGFAIHGTPKSNWRRLGRKASHGCVRVHPDNAFIFNRLVRQHGIDNVWIQITD